MLVVAFSVLTMFPTGVNRQHHYARTAGGLSESPVDLPECTFSTRRRTGMSVSIETKFATDAIL